IKLGALEKTGEEVAKAFGEEATKIVDEALKARLENHESDRRVFENFKITLADLATMLASQMHDSAEQKERISSEDSSCPLVFIIDELDRCRPIFALELLE